MISPEHLRNVRRTLGAVGFAMPSIGLTAVPPAQQQIDAARRLAAAGYRNGWANEGVGGKDVFVQLTILLANTDTMTFGTSITPVWARPPMVAHAASHQLAEAFPGRFLLGLGSGYDFMAPLAGLQYHKPIAALRDYVTRMPAPIPLYDTVPTDYATVLAANGRKSIAQATQIADGVFPSLVPPSYVEEIRSVVGDDKLVIVGLTTFIDDDSVAAQAAAARSVARIFSLASSPYARALAGLGYTEQERATGAERLVADITAHGSGAAIAASARRYLDAGADHVVLMPVAQDFGCGIDQLESVAAEVTALPR
ncbi:LLM class flavin-dependent oxidoreductase [Mycolicibacterium mengxianglii]|uniref:LLM class flavin-dependent oxidoreductase n=1 Tax=Mycolicibacterium mengxianglii TaxID=2736649 RepID=UPI0018D13476|nr:LLM class flavin-dependent oxidoreductase [Mycolicibacterium mengxianglii]